jgi:hypothetical protein
MSALGSSLEGICCTATTQLDECSQLQKIQTITSCMACGGGTKRAARLDLLHNLRM